MDTAHRYEHTLQLPDGEWELQVEAHGSAGTTAFGGVAIAAPAAASQGSRRLLSLLGDPSSPRVQRIRRSLLREPGVDTHVAAVTAPALVDQVRHRRLVALACFHTYPAGIRIYARGPKIYPPSTPQRRMNGIR